MKSKIIDKKPFEKDLVVVVDNVQIDPKAIEGHRQRINTIFADKPETYRMEQVNKMIIHDILFSRAMDTIFEHYKFDIDPEEKKFYQDFIMNTNKESIDPNKMDDNIKRSIELGAEKIIIQKLIFEDVQKEHNITVTDNELEDILSRYYRDTNQSIREFKQNPQKYEDARLSIINEKTIGTIIGMFKFDMDPFFEKLKSYNPNNNNSNTPPKNN